MSSIDLVRRYLRERFPLRMFVPLPIALALAGWAMRGGATTVASLLVGAATAFTLVAAARILDDVADRDRDAIRHPQRVLVTAPRTTPIVVAGSLPGIAGLLLAWRTGGTFAATLLVATFVVLAGWYLVRRAVTGSPLANAMVVLVKYPVIALAASGAAPVSAVRAAVGCVVVYALALGYELAHDPAARLRRPVAIIPPMLVCALVLERWTATGAIL